jgi:transglutaminase-like putative cysteine protease
VGRRVPNPVVDERWRPQIELTRQFTPLFQGLRVERKQYIFFIRTEIIEFAWCILAEDRMKLRWAQGIAIATALPLLVLAAARAPENTLEKVRRFEFTYQVTVKNLLPENHLVRVWIPVATSDQNQDVILKNISSPVPTRITHDREYKNQILYAEIRNPKDSNATFSLDFEVTRKEYSKGNYEQLMRFNGETQRAPASVERFVQPDRLVPIDGKMKELADENTQGKQGAVEKARAIYDYVFKTLRYDKSGTGWGRGDSLWACDAKHGNCTDFHSLFISMMRAEKIPARFEIGFPLPENTQHGEISGYHCWAEFYITGAGWVPVDISEAWQNPARLGYFFGALDPNRVQFTIGRDLTLAPHQAGPPLNYFVYPYVEVDGKPYDSLDKKFAFRDFSESRVSSGGR